jgi:hypothetical protein
MKRMVLVRLFRIRKMKGRSAVNSIGIIAALFAFFYGFEVFYRSIQFSQYKYLGVISGLAIILNVLGLVLGILGLRSILSRRRFVPIGRWPGKGCSANMKSIFDGLDSNIDVPIP